MSDQDFSYMRGQLVLDGLDHQRRMMAGQPRVVNRPLPVSARAAEVAEAADAAAEDTFDAVADAALEVAEGAAAAAPAAAADAAAAAAPVVAQATEAAAGVRAWKMDANMLATAGFLAVAVGVGSMMFAPAKCQRVRCATHCPVAVDTMLSDM